MTMSEPLVGYRIFYCRYNVSGIMKWENDKCDKNPKFTLYGFMWTNEPYKPGQIMKAQCKAKTYVKTRPKDSRFAMHTDKNACKCGIYSFDDLTKGFNEFLKWSPPKYFLLAKILMWGCVHIHTDGYRAEFAYPSTFYFSKRHKNSDIVQQFANAWGVESLELYH